jgi:succinate dehydrogenase hydrophobic anchor subunit
MKHWLIQRLTAFALLGSVYVGFFFDPTWFLLSIVLIAFHAEQGADSILMDYVHSGTVRKLASDTIFFLLVLTVVYWFFFGFF